MSSFRSIFCDVADTLRELSGVSVFDIRTCQLTIRTRTYPGGRRSSEASYTDSDLVIPQYYKFRNLKQEEISSSGGKYEVGDVIGTFTPRGDSRGFTQEQLAPKPTSDGVDIIYVLTDTTEGSNHSGEYSRVEIRTFRPFRTELILRRRITKP